MASILITGASRGIGLATALVLAPCRAGASHDEAWYKVIHESFGIDIRPVKKAGATV